MHVKIVLKEKYIKVNRSGTTTFVGQDKFLLNLGLFAKMIWSFKL